MFRVIMTSCSLPFEPCALARKGGPGGLAPRAGGLGGPSAPPGQQGGLGGGTPPNVGSGNFNFFSPEGMPDLVLFVTVFN